MKTVKVTLDSYTYPLFIDTGLIGRIDEICDLYRFPTRRIVISGVVDGEMNSDLIDRLKKYEILFVQAGETDNRFDLIAQIFDQLPFKNNGAGITLIAIGEDWLIKTAGFASRLLAAPTYLICIPVSFWSMLETGINDEAFLNWRNEVAVLKVNYCPKLVFLDGQFLSGQTQNDSLLASTVVLRQLLLIKPDLFHNFQSNFPEIFSPGKMENNQVLEELITSRLELYKNKTDRKCLNDFGVRFLNHYRATKEIWPDPVKMALLVFVDICWRWQTGKTLQISDADESDAIFSLIEKICLKYRISSAAWEQAKKDLAAMFSAKLLSNIFLPVSIGKLQLINSIDLDMAKKCLAAC